MPQKLSKVKILIVAGVIAILGTTLLLWWRPGHVPAAGKTLTLYGNIDLREIQLAFDEPARIVGMEVQAGDPVRKGQIVAHLDARRYVAQLARAKATLAASQAILKRLLAGTRPQQIVRLRALVAAASANLALRDSTYLRINNLLHQHAASKQSRDQARSTLQAARAQLRADRAGLDLARAGPRRETITAARARVAVAQAELDLAAQALHDTALKAPAKGVIRNRILEPGDMASPNQSVYSLALTDPLWVRAYVDEPDLGRIRPGLSATIRSDSFPDRRFRGWIGYISPSAEFTPKSVQTRQVRTELVYQVRIYVCNPQGRLRLGMPVSVTVALSSVPQAKGPQPCRRLPQP